MEEEYKHGEDVHQQANPLSKSQDEVVYECISSKELENLICAFYIQSKKNVCATIPGKQLLKSELGKSLVTHIAENYDLKEFLEMNNDDYESESSTSKRFNPWGRKTVRSNYVESDDHP